MSANLNEIIYELAEELVDPSEAVLAEEVDDTLDTEDDITIDISDYDDDIINFIDGGNRVTNDDPIDFSDFDF